MSSDGRPPERSRQKVDISEQEWGSDFVADLLDAYGFEFISFNPGASFRGLEESIINYNGNEKPTVVQTQNEALSVSIAHGYAKATGEPAVCALHNTVGTLNGAMSIFNAYIDQVPIVILGGNGPLRKSRRRPWIDWVHSHLNQASLVRDIIKWNDEPAHVDGVAESLLRSFRIADNKPKGPVYVTIDHDIQECELDEPITIPEFSSYPPPSNMAPDPKVIETIADTLVSAEMPVILVDKVGDSREAVDALVALSEELGAPVVDTYGYLPHRYNFPNTHSMDLTGTDVVSRADVVLALDVLSIEMKTSQVDTATHVTKNHIPDDAVVIEIGVDDLEASSFTFDYFELFPTDHSVLADTKQALPILHDAVHNRLEENAGLHERINERTKRIAKLHKKQRDAWKKEAVDNGKADETPIAPSYLAYQLGEVISEDEWVIVAGTLGGWPHRLWTIDEFDKYIGGMSGGGGIGYGIGAAIGGALAYQESNRVPINLQADGDLMQFLSGLWTVGHHEIPLFTIVHNNGCLFNSTNHRMELASFRGRDDSFKQALIGTSIRNPRPDFAKIANSLGINGFGPIREPNDIKPTLEKAWTAVKAGHPVLVDVICQPR